MCHWMQHQERSFSSDGAEYIMFADTIGTYPVIQNETFKVPVVSTIACDYDRTFAVEVIDKGSNAIENLHYRLKSNTIVIPAGQLRTDVEVEGIYENIGDTDSLGFKLRLVIPSELEMPMAGTDEKFGLETNCVLLKVCPFDISAYQDIVCFHHFICITIRLTVRTRGSSGLSRTRRSRIRLYATTGSMTAMT